MGLKGKLFAGTIGTLGGLLAASAISSAPASKPESVVDLVKPDTAYAEPLEARATDQKAMKYFRKGYELAQQGNYEEALEMYRKGKEVDPSVNKFPNFKSQDAKALYDKGLALSDKNRPQAVEYFKKAAEKEPSNPLPYNGIGWALLENGNGEESIEFFKRALSLQPNYTPSIGGIGKYLTDAGRHNEAYFWNTVYVQLEPSPTFKKIGEQRIGINQKNMKN